MFRRHPLILVLWSPDFNVRSILSRRAEGYKASNNSGFDLEVYVNGNEMTPIVDGWVGCRAKRCNPFIDTNGVSLCSTQVLLTTQVHAKVVADDDVPDCFAFKLQARSSLAGRGWMLGNGVGLIDRGYCDPLKASLVRHGSPDRYCNWQQLCQDGRTVVQIVAPDDQPFDFIEVLDSQYEWDDLVAKLQVKDREGGFGSTDAVGR
jgi:dUTPase